jgi:hypothetical protein
MDTNVPEASLSMRVGHPRRMKTAQVVAAAAWPERDVLEQGLKNSLI